MVSAAVLVASLSLLTSLPPEGAESLPLYPSDLPAVTADGLDSGGPPAWRLVLDLEDGRIWLGGKSDPAATFSQGLDAIAATISSNIRDQRNLDSLRGREFSMGMMFGASAATAYSQVVDLVMFGARTCTGCSFAVAVSFDKGKTGRMLLHFPKVSASEGENDGAEDHNLALRVTPKQWCASFAGKESVCQDMPDKPGKKESDWLVAQARVQTSADACTMARVEVQGTADASWQRVVAATALLRSVCRPSSAEPGLLAPLVLLAPPAPPPKED